MARHEELIKTMKPTKAFKALSDLVWDVGDSKECLSEAAIKKIVYDNKKGTQ